MKNVACIHRVHPRLLKRHIFHDESSITKSEYTLLCETGINWKSISRIIVGGYSNHDDYFHGTSAHAAAGPLSAIDDAGDAKNELAGFSPLETALSPAAASRSATLSKAEAASRPQLSSKVVASVNCFIGIVASSPNPAIPTTHNQMMDILPANACSTWARNVADGSVRMRGMTAYDISALVGNCARKSAGRRDFKPFWRIVVPNVTPNVLDDHRSSFRPIS